MPTDTILVPRARTRHRRPLCAVLVFVLALVGCGSDVDGGSDSSGLADLPTQDRPFSASGDDVETAEAAPPVEGCAVDFDAVSESRRARIETAALRVETDDVATAAQRAVVIAESAGGILFAENSTYGDQRRAVLTVKVPPAEFTSVLAELAELGTLLERSVSTDDVTEQMIDLESRVATAEASIERVRGFMTGVTDIAGLSRLEGELLVRETDLETLQAQLRTLENQVDLATIVFTAEEPSGEVEVTINGIDDGDDELPGFSEGLDAGWTAFVTVGSVVMVVVGATLPFLPFVLAVVIGSRWIARRNGEPATT